MNQLKTFTISSRPYYEQYNKCYKNILTVNGYPQGPLKNFVRRVQFAELSPYQRFSNTPCNPIDKCGLALSKIFFNPMEGCCNNNYGNKCDDLMSPNEMDNLVSYLLNNGYQIETQITNMLNGSKVKSSNLLKNVFTVTYYGESQPNVTYMR